MASKAFPPSLTSFELFTAWFNGGVGNIPTDFSFLDYLQSSDKGTRQFSDTHSLDSQFSDRSHRLS